MTDNLIHGAKWWKFDFHNHTPKSVDFGRGDDTEKNVSCQNWLLQYMRKEIDCIAVTDHNTGAYIDELKKTYLDMKENQIDGFRDLYIFPGVEISVNGGIHLLAILDLDANSEDIAKLIGNCKYQGSSGDSNGVTTESLESVIELIIKAGGIAIPAHVDKGAGLFYKYLGKNEAGEITAEVSGVHTGITLAQVLGSNRENLLAIELIDKTYNLPETYKQSKLFLAEVVGSDSHKLCEIGTNYTWVKMSVPSLDALKLALHDREDGIIRKDEIVIDPNSISNRYFIKSISVTSGFKAGNGNPLKSEFSPWLTSIIGGRGSGKSTILNYLRIALARTDEMPDEVLTEFKKFYKIAEKNGTGMLRNETAIEVEIYKDGKLHLIKWSNSTHTLQEWNVTKANWDATIAVSNIKELFPIQIFSQKELYALTGNPSKLIELIDSQFDKPAWNEAKDNLVNRWIADRAKLRQLQNAISEESNIIAQLSSTSNKIDLYESSAYKHTLNNFNKLTATNKFFTDTSEIVSHFISQLEETKKKVPNIDIPEGINDIFFDDTLHYVENMNNALKAAKEKLEEAVALVNPYKENLPKQLIALPWFEQFEAAKQAYTEIAESIMELGTESYEAMILKRATLNDKLALIENQKEELSTLKANLEILYDSIIDKEKELRSKRNEIIGRWRAVDDTNNPFLIIELKQMADAEKANETFRQLIRKSAGEFSDYIYSKIEEDETSRGLIADIINESESTRWEKRQTCINEFLAATEVDKKHLDLRLVKHLDQLKQNTPEDIDRLNIWVPEDKLVLKFKKQGREEDIQTGSAGERTAGMLGLLLALNDIPLIIDQPEDDLDTKLISKFVVEGFKKLKKKRQMVIVTHNPNIAVNANSDNIVHMDFVSGQIINAGNNALQDKQIRNAVCEVMEGGRDALNKRYYRISKALKN
jgi:ABC-type lipoprotein export system ATPase subunit